MGLVQTRSVNERNTMKMKNKTVTFNVKHRPRLELTAESDGTVTVKLFDPAFGKIWEGWCDDGPSAIRLGKRKAKEICGTDDVEIGKL